MQRQRDVREIVFGAKDGVLTTMGVVTGLGAATNLHSTIIITGLLALLAGALSMGVGQYQGAKSERDVVIASIEMEKAEIAADPQGEFAEQVAYYKTKGFTAEESQMIVARLVKNPDIFFYEMMRDEFGIDPRVAEESSVRPAVAMAASYAVGSALPILPYAIPTLGHEAVWFSVALALVGLFGIGYYAASLAGRSPLMRGLEIAAWGSGVFAVTFLAGRLIPPLFGHAPISVG